MVFSSAPPLRVRQRSDELTVMVSKPFAGSCAEWLDEVQVMVSRYRRAVAQIGCQQWQLGVDVDTHSIPAQQRVYREGMTKIVNPWKFPFQCDDTALLKQWPQTELQTRSAISSSTPGGVPDESCVWSSCEPPLGSGTQIALDLIGNAAIDRKQSGFVELRFANKQGRLLAIVVAESKLQ